MGYGAAQGETLDGKRDMKYAKIDSNQPEIVAAFRKCGFTVRHTHMVGKGFVDIVVGRSGSNTLVEIKDGSLPASKQKLTPMEQEFFDHWRGTAVIVSSVADVLALSKTLP